eukprot:2911182-Lingulodinium_polyedra.AAC.1
MRMAPFVGCNRRHDTPSGPSASHLSCLSARRAFRAARPVARPACAVCRGRLPRWARLAPRGAAQSRQGPCPRTGAGRGPPPPRRAASHPWGQR